MPNPFKNDVTSLTTYFLRGGIYYQMAPDPYPTQDHTYDNRYYGTLVVPLDSRLVGVLASISTPGNSLEYFTGIETITLKHRPANEDDTSTEMGTLLITPGTEIGCVYNAKPDAFANVIPAGDVLSFESNGWWHEGHNESWFDLVFEMEQGLV